MVVEQAQKGKFGEEKREKKENEKGIFQIPTNRKAGKLHARKLKIFYMFLCICGFVFVDVKLYTISCVLF